MRIIMVNDYKEQISGAEVYMYTLRDSLQAAGHTVEVLTSGVSRDEYLRRLRHIPLSVYLRRIFDPRSFLAFGKMVRRFRPDVVHVHSYFELSPAFLWWCRNIPTVMTIHDQRVVSAIINPQCTFGKAHGNVCPGCHECVGWKGALYERAKRLVHRPLLKNIRLFLTPSKFMREQVRQFLPGARIKVLANGLVLPKARPLPGTRHLMCVGRLSKPKGVDVLIRAMPAIRRAIPTARLSIVGDGEHRAMLKGLVAEYKLQDAVTFTGEVPSAQVPDLLYTADILVIPSAYPDNLPTVCVLGLATGRVVVASRIGGLPEMVQDGQNGLLVESGNPEALAKALIGILKNPGRMQKLAKQASFFAQRYAIESHIISLLASYEDISRN
ncbi:MAG: glycosyltransferase family 4 protein [Patescibacteria group bacterium]|nr:glycosyltransferase family 4 protein [Patescibacteria group bacterium]